MSWMTEVLRVVTALLVSLVHPWDGGGGGDTGTVILPSNAVRTLSEPAQPRGSWSVESIENGLQIALPAEMSSFVAVSFSVPCLPAAEAVSVVQGGLSLDAEVLSELAANGHQRVTLDVLDAHNGLTVTLRISFGPESNALIEAF